jgi:hypothetical protein
MGVVDFPLVSVIGTSRKPKRYDMEIYQGDTFTFYLTFGGAGLDVTGWTASAKVKTLDGVTTVADAITISAVDTVNKRFLISVDSDLLDFDSVFKYDVQVVSGTEKRTFIGGKITTTEDITEP